MHPANERGHRPSSAGQCNCNRPSALRHAHERLNVGRARRTCLRRDSFKAGEPSSESHANVPPSPFGPSTQAITRANAAERQASAGAHDGVKGQRRTLAVRAPLHALVRRHSHLTTRAPPDATIVWPDHVRDHANRSDASLEPSKPPFLSRVQGCKRDPSHRRRERA